MMKKTIIKNRMKILTSNFNQELKGKVQFWTI